MTFPYEYYLYFEMRIAMFIDAFPDTDLPSTLRLGDRCLHHRVLQREKYKLHYKFHYMNKEVTVTLNNCTKYQIVHLAYQIYQIV